MAGFPSVKKGNKLGEKAKQKHAGIPLDKTVSTETVKKLLLEHLGNVSRVADVIGTCRGTVSRMIEKYPDLTATLKQTRERWLDNVEQSVFSRAADSNDTALQCFVLKTQGKHRGWEQDENKNAAKDIASAAFEYIIGKNKQTDQRVQ